MNKIILLTIIICIVLIFGISYLAVWLSKKKVSGTKFLNTVETGLGFARTMASAINPFMPTIANNVVNLVLNYASRAVASVEDIYKATLLIDPAADDTRKAYANNMIQSALALEGIPMTQDTQKLIDAIMPLFIMALPKTHEPIEPVPEVEAVSTAELPQA